MANVRIVNRQNQLINLLVKNEDGSIGTRALLPRQSISLPAGMLAEQVFDLNRRGHVTLAQASAKPDQTVPAKTPVAKGGKYTGPTAQPYKAPNVATTSTKV